MRGWMLMSLLLLSPAVSAQITCWTDAQQQRVCGDRVPPDAAQRERTVFDAQGRAVQTMPRRLTAEELHAQQQREKRERDSELQRRQREARDRALLARYASLDEVHADGVKRVEQFDERRQMAEQALADAQAAVTALDADVQRAADADAQSRLEQYRAAVVERQRNVTELGAQREQVCAAVNADIQRYVELAAPHTAVVPSACAAR